MKCIPVLLAEDHTMVRQGLRVLLERAGGFAVVAEAANGREAVELARAARPAVVILDIAMPVLNGFEAARQILVEAPDMRVLALSAHGDDDHVKQMEAAGAAGFVLKQDAGDVLMRAVRNVAAGRCFYSSSIAIRRRAAGERASDRGRGGGPRTAGLSAREAEVLQLVAEGAANKQIASTLGISIKTVEKHRQQLMDKLNIHDTAGLTRHAIATGVIETSRRAPSGSEGS